MKNLILLTLILAGLNTFAENSTQNNVDFSCPDNYVRVPALEGYTKNDFCVMKYEAKNDGSGNAISQASGTPYVEINRDDSIDKCTSLGKGYHLITNVKWQSIARNIELVPSNWDTGSVGSSGGLSRGHSDNSPGSALAASSDDTEGCFETGQTCSNTMWNDQRRTHTLSNGEVIWDIAGNVQEWVEDKNDSIYGSDAYFSEVTAISHSTSNRLGRWPERHAKDQFGPSGDYTTDNKIIRFIRKFGPIGNYDFSTRSRGDLGLGFLSLRKSDGVIRGGYWGDGPGAGLFTVSSMHLWWENKTVGFRCVFRP